MLIIVSEYSINDISINAVKSLYQNNLQRYCFFRDLARKKGFFFLIAE